MIKSSIKERIASDDENLFERLLDDVLEAFVYWRSIYEKQEGSVNINFLEALGFFRFNTKVMKMKNVIHIYGASGSGTSTLEEKLVKN